MSRTAGSECIARLAAFAADLAPARLPPAIVETAEALVLYGLAVGIASLRARQPAIAASQSALGTEGRSTRFHDGRKVAPSAAAFANGTLLHARIQEDSHPTGHLGVVIIPAALAMAEDVAASGADLIAAIVGGYEVALRIGRDHAADLSARGLRTTPVYGVFGAAVATARLMRCDAARMSMAIALAAGTSSGLREFSAAGTTEYAYQPGFAAMNGIVVGGLAAAGAEAALSALDGEAGFYRAFGMDRGEYGARLSAGLGTTFELEQVSFKPYPICQFHRGFVAAAIELTREAAGRPLGELVVNLHPFEADFYGVRYKGPFASFPQTFMSAPFCAAVAWSRGRVHFADLNDFAAADVLALVPRITIVADPSRPRYGPRIEARLQDGGSLVREATEGAGAYRLTWPRAMEQTRALFAELGLAPGLADRLVSAARDLHRAPNCNGLLAASEAACAAARATS